jgi:hypothetical protein
VNERRGLVVASLLDPASSAPFRLHTQTGVRDDGRTASRVCLRYWYGSLYGSGSRESQAPPRRRKEPPHGSQSHPRRHAPGWLSTGRLAHEQHAHDGRSPRSPRAKLRIEEQVPRLTGCACSRIAAVDRAVRDVAPSRAIVSGGADGRLLMGGSTRSPRPRSSSVRACGMSPRQSRDASRPEEQSNRADVGPEVDRPSYQGSPGRPSAVAAHSPAALVAVPRTIPAGRAGADFRSPSGLSPAPDGALSVVLCAVCAANYG